MNAPGLGADRRAEAIASRVALSLAPASRR
jgi:hypothetical protein